MQYTSTRSNILTNASQAILDGLAQDGGLYVPSSIPKLDYRDLKNKSYQELAVLILSLYFEDFSNKEITNAILKAYSSLNFTHPLITGLRKYDADTYFLELFYGKTSAFKDQALSIYPYLLKLAMDKHQIDHLTILTATSGDTGKAAMESIADVDGLSIAVLFPKDGTSPIQKLQMQTQHGKNVLPVAIEGNFDDAQNAVKTFFLKHDTLPITSANSINIARLLPQIIYYYDMYLRLHTDEFIDLYVPTGNFGNILAAYIAKEMGLPIRRLVVCTNENHVLYDFFKTGTYDISNRKFKVTHSPSMDILISSNLERLLYFMFNDKEKVSKWMHDLKENKSFSLSKEETNKLQSIFDTQMCSNQQTYENIKDVFFDKDILIDPHTATAMPQTKEDTKRVIVSTASPYKFPKLYGQLFDLMDHDDFHILNEVELKTKEPFPENIRSLESAKPKFNLESSLEDIENLLLKFIASGDNYVF